MVQRRQVALLIETSFSYGRGLLRGIGSYARLRSKWAITHHERGLAEGPPPWLAQWRGDGIIARIETDRLADAITKRALPTVDLSGVYELPDVVTLITDPVTTAEMAFRHLIECGVDHLAYCGYPGVRFSDERGAAFAAIAKDHQRPCDEYRLAPPTAGAPATLALHAERGEYDKRLSRWLRSLPKPVGIMACNDERARQVLRACVTAELPVPDCVAVVGVDNDEVDCELADPPLTSLQPATHKLGFRAAELLDQIIDGKTPTPKFESIPPCHIEERRSTDVIATSDPCVAAALRYIRDHACDGIDVGDLLGHVQVSRTTLERRFAKIVGRSPKEQIMNVRLSHVKRLLRETEFTLPTIAHHTGFKTYEHMSKVFRRHFDISPRDYRRRP